MEADDVGMLEEALNFYFSGHLGLQVATLDEPFFHDLECVDGSCVGDFDDLTEVALSDLLEELELSVLGPGLVGCGPPLWFVLGVVGCDEELGRKSTEHRNN